MADEFELIDVEGQVAAHRELLDQLMQGIDDSQETVDALREQISETEIDINHVRSEIAELQKVRQTRNINTTVFTDCPDFDMSLLNPEHQDHLNAVLDRIYDLERELEEKEVESTHAQSECDAIARENQSLEQELARTKAAVENAERERRRVETSIENSQRRLKELQILSQTNKQNLSVTEVAVAGLEGRQESLKGKTGGIIELERSIASLQEEVSREQDALDEQRLDTEKVKERMTEDLEEINKHKTNHTELLQWESENEKVLAEIASVKQQLEEAKKANEAESGLYVRLSKRYRDLNALFNKWEGRDIPPCRRSETLDQLFAELAKTEKGTTAATEKRRADLEQIIISNSILEEKIKRKREEIERGMALFTAEQASLKEQVDGLRLKSFEEEQQLVQQINALKLKLAQQKANKQGC